MKTEKAGERFSIGVIGVVLFLTIFPFVSHAAIPQKINYQGSLTNAAGVPANGAVQMVFSIYNVSSGGVALWTETQNVTVTHGVYNVELGDVTPITLLFDIPYYLGIRVGADPEMTPRIPLTSVGYAFRAQTADNAGTGTITGVSAGTGLTGGGTSGSVTLSVLPPYLLPQSCGSGQIASWNGSLWICAVDQNSGGTITGVTAGNGLTGGGSSGSVTLNVGAGAGITVAADLVSVNFAGSGSAATVSRGDHDHFSGYWSGNNSSYGLAVNNGGTGDGIRAFSSSTLHNYAGLYAANSSTGTGVYGSSVGGYGVYGTSSSSSGYGGYFENNNGEAIYGSGSTGVRGVSSLANGTGIVGICNDGSNAWGVFGGSTSGYAGLFSGNVQVNGTLSKSSGAFKIDHPLDPANKYLYHSFVESPDMKNIYDGVVELDQRGEAIVMLPEWFGALNRDFRYQLTCIGGYAPVYIAEEITDNRFRISGGTPSLKVSWQVTGIRQDKWANDHRIPVEEAKPSGEIGTYLYPQGFGQSDELRVDGARIKALKSPAPRPLKDVNKDHLVGIGVKP
jgi:hypothetical protein